MTFSLRPRTFQEQLLEEVEVNDSVGGDWSENEDRVSVHSESSDFSNEDSDSDLEDIPLSRRLAASRGRSRPKAILRGVDGYRWQTKKPGCPSDYTSEIPSVFIPGPTNTSASTIEEFWDLLFDSDMIDLIIKNTNKQIEDVCSRTMAEDKNMESYHGLTDRVEIRALIGLLYYSGWWRQSDVNSHYLWDQVNSITVYRCTMPRDRFLFLFSCLRFDDKSTRNATDRFAPIRELWDKFIANCTKYYTPHQVCTVDEQLLGFRGKCMFRMYIKSKPERYGIKLISLNDAVTSYMYNAVPYLGRSTTPQNQPVSEYLLHEVTAPIHGTRRTVTCDSWFTSIPYFQKMVQEPYELTFTGTVRKNKRQIPQEMKVAAKETPAAKYCFANNLMLLSYSHKKNKIALVASTYSHSTEDVDEKPAIIHHYSVTRGGTDVFDKLVHAHTVSRNTNRWPLRVFFGMLDQAAVNARILLKCKHYTAGDATPITAGHCLKNLYFYLVRDHLIERYCIQTLRLTIRKGISEILSREAPEIDYHGIEHRPRLDKQARCGMCTRKKDRKSYWLCPSCERPMCDEHRAYLCNECSLGIE